ncbi:CinA family protein [Cellulomonas endophytica]|uniref:CinA family protein n=1 Tax=Cellulomonas endophytica TaxID=2494735 RepID=UPI00101261B6|nr:CinA family protein [Cellulomonas endophytica]
MTGAGPAATDATARRLLQALEERGLTVAAAESLTGGLVVAALVAVPGASTVLRGGVVAYATDLKARLLGVDARLLDERGPVDPDVARAMAEGVRDRLRADVGLATTGVAGPGPQDGHPAGEVHVAVALPGRTEVASHRLAGERPEVRDATVGAVLELAVRLVAPDGGRGLPGPA